MKDFLEVDPNVSWPEHVPEIDTEDPVLGGKDGIVNRPHQALAERTEWLKNNTPTSTDFDNHKNETAVHSATPNPVPHRIVMRDDKGRAKGNDPLDRADYATKGYIDDLVGNAENNPAADLSKHIEAHAVHKATPKATPDRIVMRDGDGRAQGADPEADADYATKKYVDGRTPPAAGTAPGLIQIATQDEVIEGRDQSKAVTPATLQGKTATTDEKGIVQLASQAETIAGADAEKAITAATLQGKTASAATAARIIIRDTNGKAQVATPVSSDPATTIATKEYVDKRSGGMFNRRLIVTTSKSQPDPSNGLSPAFRITCVGGGRNRAYSTNLNTGKTYYCGGGGATVIAILPKSVISWPVQITIGGTTMFGSYIAAAGGGETPNGAGTTEAAMPFLTASGGNNSTFRMNVAAIYADAAYANGGIEHMGTPYFSMSSGTAGNMAMPGGSLVYLAGLGNYGVGEKVNSSGSVIAAATPGVVFIDYYDPAY